MPKDTEEQQTEEQQDQADSTKDESREATIEAVSNMIQAKDNPPEDPDEVPDEEEQDDSQDESIPELPKKVLDAGKFFGLTQNQIQEMSDKQRDTLVERRSRLNALERQVGSTKDAEDKPDEEADSEPDIFAKIKKLEQFQFDEEYLGDDSEKLTDMRDAILELTKHITSLSGQQKDAEEYIQRQQQQSAVREADAFFDSLEGDSYQDMFGTGSISELSEDSSEFQNRVKVFDEASLLLENHDMSIREALEKAMILTNGDVVQQAQQEKLQASSRKRSRQRTPKPSNRNSVPAATDPRQKAIQALTEKLS